MGMPPEGDMPEGEMGAEGEMPMGDAAAEDSNLAEMAPNENIRRNLKNLINEQSKSVSAIDLINRLSSSSSEKNEIKNVIAPLSNKNFLINEELDTMSRQLEKTLRE